MLPTLVKLITVPGRLGFGTAPFSFEPTIPLGPASIFTVITAPAGQSIVTFSPGRIVIVSPLEAGIVFCDAPANAEEAFRTVRCSRLQST